MKLSQTQEKALARAEKCVKATKQLRWQVPLYIIFMVGIWAYAGYGKSFAINILFLVLLLSTGMFWKMYVVLSDLLQAFRDLVNADPQALAQHYSTKLGNDDPESIAR